MKTLFFCARDIRDYFGGIIDTRDLNAAPANYEKFSALNDAPDIQKFLFDLMEIYDHRDAGCNSAICGETGIDGLRLDFNFGLRLEVPRGNFHVTISDDAGDEIFFERDLSDVRLISVEKYFIRWRVEVFLDGEKIFSHAVDLAGQTILIAFSKQIGLGDALAMLPFAKEFAKIHGCRVEIFLYDYLREFAANLYPELVQVDTVSFEHYATYFLAMYGGSFPFCRADFRNEPLEKMAGMILGINTLPKKPTFKPTLPRQISEPYVCIGVQASATRKGWLYPGGWNIVVDCLKNLGYRVLCIDRHAQQTNDGITIRKPANAEDFTGDFSIMERANMLYHAEFFIGLGSGLSWLAYAVNCPVVMICGFSKDWFEFYTPYRVANRLVCNGCFNDVRVNFVWNVCPYHKGTPRELECQKKISPRQVLNAIERLIVDKNLRHNDS